MNELKKIFCNYSIYEKLSKKKLKKYGFNIFHLFPFL